MLVAAETSERRLIGFIDSNNKNKKYRDLLHLLRLLQLLLAALFLVCFGGGIDAAVMVVALLFMTFKRFAVVAVVGSKACCCQKGIFC